MSSASAATCGRTPSRSARASKPMRTPLSPRRQDHGLRGEELGDRAAARIRAGLPTRLTRCSATRCETKGVTASGAGTRFVRTTSRLSASSAARSSAVLPERSTTSTSGRPRMRRRKPIWKLRESVASAPTRSACRAPPAWRSVPEQLLAGREDRVGVVERDAPRLGQVELAAAPLEQGMAEALLQLADLHRERGLRQVQPLGRARQVAVVRDRPEVAEGDGSSAAP